MPGPPPQSAAHPGQFDRRRVARLFGRALRLRCPSCGARPLFSSWFTMLPGCTVCGLQLDRGESGYEVGSYMVNLFATEAVLALALGLTLVVTWPSPPWTLLMAGSVLLVIAAPLVLFPFAKTVFLALDLLFRPADGEPRA